MAIAGLILLAGCGGGGGGGDAAPTPEAAEPTAPAAPIVLGEVVWATEVDPDSQEPLDIEERYPNNAPAIIAAVPVRSVPAGAVITATWTIDGTEVPEVTSSVTADAPVNEGWVSFRFTRDPDRLFPLGILGVTVTAADGASTTSEVEIVLP
jgi:hypothetical protein